MSPKKKKSTRAAAPKRKRAARRAGPRPKTAAAPALESATAAEDWDAFASDTDSPLGRCAANALERHQTLDHAVVSKWAAEDIGVIRRVESGGRCMWVMWRRSSSPPA